MSQQISLGQANGERVGAAVAHRAGIVQGGLSEAPNFF